MKNEEEKGARRRHDPAAFSSAKKRAAKDRNRKLGRAREVSQRDWRKPKRAKREEFEKRFGRSARKAAQKTALDFARCQ